MRVRARTGEWDPKPPSPIPEGVRFRRTMVYPHRSFRHLPLTMGRLALAAGAAFLLSIGVGLAAGQVLEWHGAMVEALLRMAGIPVRGWLGAEIFPLLPETRAPVVTVPEFLEIDAAASLTLIAGVVGLLMLYRHVSLARGFVGFLMVLLVASAGAVAFHPGYRIDSLTFTRLWLRGEVLVWLALPWLSACLFLLIQPRRLSGVAWMVGLEAYLIAFSSLRMTFCLGVLHLSGLLFFPVLWFLFGLLAVITAVLVAYSISINDLAGRLWGARNAWHS